MISQQEYVSQSLELHLFFGRIMKEHAIFLTAGFTPANPDFTDAARQYQELFEIILQNAVSLANGIIRPSVITSGELVTDYTFGSEQKTQHFTGILIDTNITTEESRLTGSTNPQITPELTESIRELNSNTMQYLDSYIDFKANILNQVLSCNMFTANYPLLIDHILREAKLYREHISNLENGMSIDENLKETELFWDQIMMEHAMFIRGLLDPSENRLIQTANHYATDYSELITATRTAFEASMKEITTSTLEETIEYRDFKEQGTIGINQCRIRSIILPLLADHVLREANHYIRLLNQSLTP